MCQDMSRRGFYRLSEKEVEKFSVYLSNLKKTYEKGDFIYWTNEELEIRIKEVETMLKRGGLHYVEDPELRCCGQG